MLSLFPPLPHIVQIRLDHASAGRVRSTFRKLAGFEIDCYRLRMQPGFLRNRSLGPALDLELDDLLVSGVPTSPSLTLLPFRY